jgi:hypothetical protein
MDFDVGIDILQSIIKREDYMKKLIVLVFALIVLSGCKTPPVTEPPGDNSLIIAATLSRQESNLTLGQTVYMVLLVKGFGTPVTDAAVTVTGPGGVTILAGTGMGGYTAQFLDTDVALYYQFNGEYSVNITTGGMTYTALMRAPGGVTIPSDGAAVSWLYEGNTDSITLLGPAGSMLNLAADRVSPVDLNATGFYTTNGPGSYMIQANVVKQQTGAFSGANAGSSLIMYNQYNTTVTK